VSISSSHSNIGNYLVKLDELLAMSLKASFTAREADDIANLAFIGGKTNRGISDKPPATYLPPPIAQHCRAPTHSQSIPLDAELLEVAQCEAFLAKRRSRIAAALNAYLESA